MIDIKGSKLRELIPINLRNDEDIIAAAFAIDNSTDSVFSLSHKLGFRTNPEIKDDRILDAWAVDSHVDFYDKSFPPDVKRKIVDSSLVLHMTKGTPGSIERALLNVGVTAEVVEWYDYNSTPYHFAVEMSPNFSIVDREKMNKMVMIYKNLRSWFDGFIIVVAGGIVYIADDTYSYPVYYKTCGEFSGEKEFGQIEAGEIEVVEDSYNYLVEYPVSEKQSMQIESESIETKDDTYSYLKIFPVCGEMEPLYKEISTSSNAVEVSGESYDYGVFYPVCGEFYAEGDG